MSNPLKDIEKRFDEEFVNERFPSQYDIDIKAFIRKEFISLLEGLKEEIETIKVAVQKHHGTYKYDDCYEQCQEVIDKRIKGEKKEEVYILGE